MNDPIHRATPPAVLLKSLQRKSLKRHSQTLKQPRPLYPYPPPTMVKKAVGTELYPLIFQGTIWVRRRSHSCTQTEPIGSSGYAKRSQNGDSDSLRTQNRSHRFEWVRAWSCTCSRLSRNPPPQSVIDDASSFFCVLSLCTCWFRCTFLRTLS